MLLPHTLTHITCGARRARAPPRGPRAAGRRARRLAEAPLSTISLTSHRLKAATHSLLHCAGRRAAAGELRPGSSSSRRHVPSARPCQVLAQPGPLERGAKARPASMLALAPALPPPCHRLAKSNLIAVPSANMLPIAAVPHILLPTPSKLVRIPSHRLKRV